MYKKFLSAILIPLILLADSSEQASLLFTDDMDLIAETIVDDVKRSGSTNPVTDKFYNIPISNNSISTTNSTAGIELKQSGRYYLANSISRIPSSGKPVIKISGTDIVLDMNGFVIDGSLATSSHSDMIGIEIAASSRNVTIINGSLNTIKGMGIKVGAGTDTITVKDVKITSCADSGIECAGTSGSKIKNLFLKNVQVSSGNGSQRNTSADAYGFRAEYVVSGSVENCSFQNMLATTTGKNGIGKYLYGCEDLKISSCYFSNNKAAASIVSLDALDTSFGSSGVAALAAALEFRGVCLDQLGNIYVTGDETDGSGLILAKYTSAGVLDTTFGTAGVVSNASFVAGIDVKLDSYGNIFVIGQSTGSNGIIAKYTSSGALDTTFGSSGVATLASAAFLQYNTIIDEFGNIIVCGLSTPGSNGLIAKYTSSGTLDTTFGSSGVVTNGSTSTFRYINTDSDGNLYAVGYASVGTAAVIVKYTPSGTLDTTFGSSGIVTNSSAQHWRTIHLDDTNKIYVAGVESDGNGGLIAKYTPAGSLDTTFGSSGQVSNASANTWREMAIDDYGNIYVAGYESDGNGGLIAKYTPAGSLDTTYGSSGLVTNTSAQWFYDLKVDKYGSIYVAGRETDGNGGFLAKYGSIGAGIGVYIGGYCSGLKFKDCVANNMSGNGVGHSSGFYIEAASDCTFDNIQVLNNASANNGLIFCNGFTLYYGCNDNSFNNIISSGHSGSGSSTVQYGWRVSSNNNRFTNCVGSGIGSSSGGAAYGFYFSSTNNNNLLNCKAIGNQSSGATNCYGFYSTAGRSNIFNKCEGSSNTAVTGKCAGIALDAGEALSTISNGHFSGNQVTGAGSCYGIVLDPANASGVNRCSITNNTVSMNYATTNGATLAGLRDFTTDCNSLIAGNVLSLNGNARLNIGSAPNYNIDSADLTIDGSGNGGLNLYLTYDDGQNVADMVNETDVSNMQALSTSLTGWTNLLVVPQQE